MQRVAPPLEAPSAPNFAQIGASLDLLGAPTDTEDPTRHREDGPRSAVSPGADAHVAPGMILRERFRLVEELGRGGMGIVYKAIDQREVENRGREPYVAIKVLGEEFKAHPESAIALQRESKKAMRLAHPNIVLVRDFDRDQGIVYMVMELLHGQPLDRLVIEQYPGGMPVPLVLEIVGGLSAALSYAHQQGIVHADFKPSNAFLTNQRVVKVLDFGVARAALAFDRGDSTLFDPGKLNAVSPAYATVEMLTGGSPDPRDDIYALACVTYFLLTGRHPFNGIDAVRARDSGLRPQRIKGISEQQWQALRSALAVERWDRTASVREFAARFCSQQTNPVTRMADSATRMVSLTSELAGAAKRRALGAVRHPAWAAAPLGTVLAMLATYLLVGHWAARGPGRSQPAHEALPAEATPAPVTAAASPAAATPAPVPVQGPATDVPQPVAVTPAASPAAPLTAVPLPAAATTVPASPHDARVAPATKLREQLAQQVDAGEVEDAARTVASLRAVGSAADVRDLDGQLAHAYARLSRRQLLEGNATASLQTIAAGRKRFNTPELRQLEVAYDRVAEELARIVLAASLNVAAHRPWIDEIRQLAGDDYPAIEQLLVRTLANDIADQRARGDRAAVVSGLLRSGQELFPGLAGQLQHGTAGLQDADEVAIASEVTDAAPGPGASAQ